MLAGVLTAAIRKLVGDEPVLLAGHSTGGFTALNIAAHAPEMAVGVISIDGFAHGQWTGGLGWMQWFVRRGLLGQAIFLAWYRLNQIAPFICRPMWRFYAADWHELYRNLNPLFKQFQAPFSHLDLRNMLMYFSRMPAIDISDLLPNITAPTLALTGEKDPIVPPAQARLINRRFGQVEKRLR